MADTDCMGQQLILRDAFLDFTLSNLYVVQEYVVNKNVTNPVHSLCPFLSLS